MRLHPADVEAMRVADLLRDERPTDRLLDAFEVATRFGVERAWVYANAERLGAVRLGDGPRGRLRFDAAAVADALRDPERPSPARRRRATTRDNTGGPHRPPAEPRPGGTREPPS